MKKIARDDATFPHEISYNGVGYQKAAEAGPCVRLAPGDVIVQVQYEAVGSPTDMQKRLDALKAQGKKLAVLLVSNANGDTRFVALNLQ